MRNIITFLSSVLLLSFVSSTVVAKEANDILGIWQSFDDKTGAKKGQVKISYNKKTNSYIGRIIKVTPAKGYTPKTHCQNCPKPFTNQKIEGMLVFWNLKLEKRGNKVKGYDQGYLIDPLSGKIYRFKAAVSRNKKILQGRAYIGTALMGRSQTWVRVK